MKAICWPNSRNATVLLPPPAPWDDADDGMASSDALMMAPALVRVNDELQRKNTPWPDKAGRDARRLYYPRYPQTPSCFLVGPAPRFPGCSGAIVPKLLPRFLPSVQRGSPSRTNLRMSYDSALPLHWSI